MSVRLLSEMKDLNFNQTGANGFKASFNFDLRIDKTTETNDVLLFIKQDANNIYENDVDNFSSNNDKVYLLLDNKQIDSYYTNLMIDKHKDGNKYIANFTPNCFFHPINLDVDLKGKTLTLKFVTKGATLEQSYRIIPFISMPTISDQNKNLGSKNKGWDLVYYVDCQDKSAKLLTTVKLNDTVIQTYQDTQKYTTLVCQITDAMIEKLTYNKQNTLTITCTNTDTNETATRIFTFTRVNTPPKISGNDENLGVQQDNMQQFFTVTDAEHDEVIVTVKVDNITIDTYKVDQSKKYSAYIPIDIWNRLSNGGHKLYIIAKDSHENTSTRTYTFSKANAIPTISDQDRNLGNKNLGFSLDYTVSDSDNDKLTIIEKLNNNVLRTLKDVTSGTKETLSISTEEIKKLAINQESKIEISVDDGKGGIAKREYTFTRINTAPAISDSDRDLGIQQYNIQQKYTVSDAEGDTVTIKEFVDNIQLNYFTATLNQERTLYIPKNVWIELQNGQHTLSIVATDSNNATSKRVYTFTKAENKIELMLKKPFPTDAKANKILITPSWYNISNADVLVETCNNAYDTNLAWEDCTKEVLANDKYTFKNSRKEDNKWGINIRFSITRKQGTTEQIIFDGFGGSFE